MDEHTPLLAPINSLPKWQLAVLCAVRLVDPLTFTQIFPYINQFLSRLNLAANKSQIGFYSGLVESTFAFFQLCSIYHWARFSDNVGRRPVILVGTFGLAISTILLGFASSLPAILVSRSLAGIFSGNVAVLHSVLCELTNAANQSIAYPIYGLFWPLGNIIGHGSSFCGALAEPALHHPLLFDHLLFRDYPYFLPCLATGSLAIIIGLIAARSFEETLPGKRRGDVTPTVGGPNTMDAPGDIPPISVFYLLRNPVIRSLCISGTALCFTATAFDAVFVLYCYTPIQLGGLDFSASQIGYALAIAGIASVLLQIIFLPTLLTHIRHARLYNLCMMFWPLTYLTLPVLNLIARGGMVMGGQHGELQPSTSYAIWLGITQVMVMSRIGCLAYSVSLILVKQNSSATALGKTNAIVLWGMCLARALAPAFVSSFFALSVDKRVFGGFLWLVVMIAISLAGCAVSLNVSHSEGYVEDGTYAANERLVENERYGGNVPTERHAENGHYR
ncbi:major facilitator superfamily domain-containing protein [Gymnopilus junonius]|uniref:Major facilitator superfamily domain-containing protein n=1 Tax=Gymnopilus junonius TaxID=109634 RepID=A0A9P5NUU9_GYMJU|nr:major facilitator superfamily domain-containing protein [Gymnopilus junonius]